MGNKVYTINGKCTSLTMKPEKLRRSAWYKINEKVSVILHPAL